MKTIIATVIALTATTASADICGYNESQIRDYPGYASTGPVYDRGEYLFTASQDDDANVIYHVRIDKETCEQRITTIDMPNDRDEAAEPVMEDGTYRTTERFWGDPSNADKAGKFRRVTNVQIVVDGVITRNVTFTFQRNPNDSVVRVVDNHILERSFRVRVNGDRTPKDYVEEGLRTVADTGNWVDTRN